MNQAVLVGTKAKVPLQLESGETFLGRTHEVERHQPAGQRNLTPLHYGADSDGELLATGIALNQTGPVSGPVEPGAIVALAMRADRTRRPKQILKVLAGVVITQFAKLLKGHFVAPVYVYSSVDNGITHVNEFVDKRERFLRKSQAIVGSIHDGQPLPWESLYANLGSMDSCRDYGRFSGVERVGVS